MKPWSWPFRAAVRTLRGIRPGWARPDDAWAEARLDAPERSLYRAMDPRDRAHAVEVACALVRAFPGAPGEVVRAALLHDVGKSRRAYRLGERIAAHLVRVAPPPPEPALHGWAGARQVAAHHGAYGAAMIRAAGGSWRVAELVARHDRPGSDRWAAILREIDRRT